MAKPTDCTILQRENRRYSGSLKASVWSIDCVQFLFFLVMTSLIGCHNGKPTDCTILQRENRRYSGSLKARVCTKNIFFYFSIKIYIVGTQKNRLNHFILGHAKGLSRDSNLLFGEKLCKPHASILLIFIVLFQAVFTLYKSF